MTTGQALAAAGAAARRFAGPVRRVTVPAVRAAEVVTGLGRTCAAVSAAGLLFGWWFGWREPVVAGLGCAAALAMAAPFVFGGAAVEVDVETNPRRVLVGEPARCAAVVHNPGARAVSGIVVEAPIRLRDSTVGAAVVEVGRLACGAREVGDFVAVPTARRGVVTVGPAVSVRTDPIGLLSRTVAWRDPVEILVHPRTVRLAGLGAGLLRDLEGQTSNDLSPNDVAFHALREYVAGDDLRHVHALTSARVGRLMVRQFVDTRTAQVSVVTSGADAEYNDPEEFETALSVAGSIALRVVGDAQRVTVLAAGQEGRASSARGRHALLDALSRADLGRPAADLAALTARIDAVAPETSLAVLITGGALEVSRLRAVAARFGPDVRVICVRVDSHGSVLARRFGATALLTVPALASLRAALQMAAKA